MIKGEWRLSRVYLGFISVKKKTSFFLFFIFFNVHHADLLFFVIDLGIVKRINILNIDKLSNTLVQETNKLKFKHSQ